MYTWFFKHRFNLENLYIKFLIFEWNYHYKTKLPYIKFSKCFFFLNLTIKYENFRKLISIFRFLKNFFSFIHLFIFAWPIYSELYMTFKISSFYMKNESRRQLTSISCLSFLIYFLFLFYYYYFLIQPYNWFFSSLL